MKLEVALVVQERNNMIIAVMDYMLGEVIIKDIPKNLQDLDGDDILSEMGFNPSTTEYMITDNDLKVSLDTQGLTGDIILK